MEIRPTAPEGRTRQRRAAVIERQRNSRALPVIDLPRKVHVERLDKIVTGLVGQFRPLQRSFEMRIDRPHPLSHLPGIQPLQRDPLHDPLQLRNDTLARFAPAQAEQLDFVMAVVFR